MKQVTFLLLTCWAGMCQAQKLNDHDVPPPVKETFQKAHPEVKKVTWEREMGHFEANFKAANGENSMLIDVMGHVVATEAEIKVAELPATVRNYLAKNYPKEKIHEAARITDLQGLVTYEAEVKGKDLIFDSSGNFQREEKEDEHDKD